MRHKCRGRVRAGRRVGYSLILFRTNEIIGQDIFPEHLINSLLSVERELMTIWHKYLYNILLLLHSFRNFYFETKTFILKLSCGGARFVFRLREGLADSLLVWFKDNSYSRSLLCLYFYQDLNARWPTDTLRQTHFTMVNERCIKC